MPKITSYDFSLDLILSFLHPQGQCYCDQGVFFEALESFAKAVELKPGFGPYHMRRFVPQT